MPRPLELLRRWIDRHAGPNRAWVAGEIERLAAGAPDRALYIFLGLAPRRLGRADLELSPGDLAEADAARPGWDPRGWSIDGAARVAGLLAHASERPFAERFKDLRRTADAGELIAFYRGLPLYPEPETLDFEVGEGLRSNIRAVFEAIAHRNPFPRDHFDEHRWNHMVLKALFVGSRLAPIQGIDERANPELARILRDYAHERWAAGRPVAPELWRPVGPFATDQAALGDLRRALGSAGPERAAAALALAASSAPGAQAILEAETELARGIREGSISWDRLAEAEPA